MNTTNHIIDLLDDYLDGVLPADTLQAVERHLAACPQCQSEYESLRVYREQIEMLPTSVMPARDLWDGIKARINALPAPRAHPTSPLNAGPVPDRLPHPSARRSRVPAWTRIGLVAVIVAIGWGVFRLSAGRDDAAWEVVAIEGSPWIGESTLSDTGQLRVGEWLETDATSRASVDVGLIGQVEVAPKTRLQLRKADAEDHRLVLAEGRIEALIWAPPRLFFVETPSALAIDLGCAYTLEVDSTGTSLLHVTAGYVQLEHQGHESLVPAGAMCMARPGKGPGTPFDENASEALRQALMRYDFENGGASALTDALAEARATDAITLWQLLSKAGEAERGRIYSRLVELVTPPAGVTREGVLARDPEMIDIWESHLGLYRFVKAPKLPLSQ